MTVKSVYTKNMRIRVDIIIHTAMEEHSYTHVDKRPISIIQQLKNLCKIKLNETGLGKGFMEVRARQLLLLCYHGTEGQGTNTIGHSFAAVPITRRTKSGSRFLT